MRRLTELIDRATARVEHINERLPQPFWRTAIRAATALCLLAAVVLVLAHWGVRWR